MRHAAAPLPIQRSDSEVNLMHADRFAVQGMHAQAIALYRTVGSSSKNRGDHRTALTAFAAVARLEGAGSHARLEMGECLAALGQRVEAARNLDQAGQELLQRGCIPHALHAFRMATSAEPTAARARTLTNWCLHFGKQAEAATYLEEILAGVGETDDARAVVAIGKALLEVAPGHIGGLRALGHAYLRLRMVHQAVDAIRRVLSVRPFDTEALEQMAEAFAILGKRHKAAEVMLRLATILLGQGPARGAEARRIIHRGLIWDPRNLNLADLQRTHCDRPRAVARELIVHEPPPLHLSEFVVGPYEQSIVELSPYELVEAYEQSVVELSPYEFAEIYDEPSPTPSPNPRWHRGVVPA